MLFTILLACSGEPTATSPVPTPSACPIGSEGCACTGGGACDGELVCEAAVCVVPACPVGSEGCACTDGGACDDPLICLDSGVCGPEPVCGNDRVEQGETCDDGNTVTETCAYGETACQVCNDACRLVPGTASYCGDAFADATNGEVCDEPGASPDCAYGQTACEVCEDCAFVPGVASYCGDGLVDRPQEDCDGGPGCLADCTFLGDAFEPNETVSNAVDLALATDGTFSHPLDLVHGPGVQNAPYFLFQSEDMFAIEVCNGGQITARVDFDPLDGTLELAVGRRPQSGSPSGPPPVLFEWFADTVGNSFQTITVDAPAVGQLPRTHYVEVAVLDSSPTYRFVPYTLTGSVTGCP
jgi:hypothetical protein